ncbi:ATP-dependent RNA helicase DHX8-like [Schistocerca gregaria]|uniref:ATP-dependent RNA helicase DHX8-like n=1 Tax=Schistocerca gregaria TaxID=7010 RepID=UPI00211EDD00|nr:ATP-dependent RNA helicase DHX8-like [Schistocerca gregaria]
MEDLAKFQHFSLVQKIMKELNNNIGMGEELVAEFIIDLADKHPKFDDFSQAIKDTGADFTDQFTATLYKLISKMRFKKPPTSASEAPRASDSMTRDVKIEPDTANGGDSGQDK